LPFHAFIANVVCFLKFVKSSLADFIKKEAKKWLCKKASLQSRHQQGKSITSNLG
jgi:hypothetical protein